MASSGALRSFSLRSLLRDATRKSTTTIGFAGKHSTSICTSASTTASSTAEGASLLRHLRTPRSSAWASHSVLLRESRLDSRPCPSARVRRSHTMRSTLSVRWRHSLCPPAATASTCSRRSCSLRQNTAGHLHWQAHQQATLRQRQQRYLAVRCCSSEASNSTPSNGSQALRTDRREGTSERPMSSLFKPKCNMKFCSACGGKVEQVIPEGDDRWRAVCTNCGMIHYVNPKMVVGAIVEHQGKVLLSTFAL